MEILVKGAYGHANFGDDALMCCLENFFIEHFSEMNITFCANNDAEYSDRLLSKADFVNISKNKRPKADLLVYGGGTQFFLFNKGSGGIRHLIKQFRRLILNSPATLIAKMKERISGKPIAEPATHVAAVGIGLGPFHPSNKRTAYIGKLVRRFNFLYVRDDQSLQYCIDWNCEEVGLGADICFSSYLGLSKRDRDGGIRIKQRKRIGVIVRDWVHDVAGSAYNAPLLDVIGSYDNSDEYEFIFVIFSLIKDVKWLDLLRREKRSFIAWDPMLQTLSDFTDILNDFDGFLTARYHGGVFAAILNKPAVCVEIEPKLKILTKQIPQLSLWEKPFNKEDLENEFKIFHERNYDCSKEVAGLRSKSDNMFKEFGAYLETIGLTREVIK